LDLFIIAVLIIIVVIMPGIVSIITVRMALRGIKAENSILNDELEDIRRITRDNTIRLHAIEQELKKAGIAGETPADDGKYAETVKSAEPLPAAAPEEEPPSVCLSETASYSAAPEPEESAEDFDIPYIPAPPMMGESIPEEPVKSHTSVTSLKTPDIPELAVNNETMENWLGKRVFGIVAAILIFIGLIYLGTLIYDKMGDNGKIALMYLFSFALTAAGVVLVKKTRNYFTIALVGCGCGALFISTLMAHIHFGKFPDYMAFSLLLGWTAGVLFLSKLMKTGLFSAIAHIGMAISLCFAFSSGMSYDKLPLILVYQWAGIAVIVAGNFFFCKQTYLPGLFASFALTLIGSLFMMDKLGKLDMNGLIFAGYTGQFALTSFLSYFLTLYVIKSVKEDATEYASAVHAGNKLLWLVSLSVNVITPVYLMYKRGVGGSGHIDAVLWQVLAGVAIIAVHAAITLIMSKKYGLNKNLETISISFLSVFSCGLLVYRLYETELFISCLFALAIAMFALYKFCRNRVYLILANIWICADVLLMISGGYNNIYESFKPSPVLYLVMIPALMAAQRFLLNKEDKAADAFYNPLVNAMKITPYILTHVSLTAFFVLDFYSYSGSIENFLGEKIYCGDIRTAIFLMIPLILNLTLFLLKFEKSSAALNCIMRITTVIILSVTALFINSGINSLLAALTLAVCLLFAYAVARISVRENNSFSVISRIGELIIIAGCAVFINSGVNALLAALTLAAGLIFAYARARISVKENNPYSVISKIGELIIIAGCAVFINSGVNSLFAVLALAGGFLFAYAAARISVKENNTSAVISRIGVVIITVGCAVYINSGVNSLLAVLTLAGSFLFAYAAARISVTENFWPSVTSRTGELTIIVGCAVYIISSPRPILDLPVEYALAAACLGFAFLLARGFTDNKNICPASAITEINVFILILSSAFYIISKDNRLMVSLIVLISLIFLILKAATVDRGGEKGRITDITEVGGAIMLAACAWYFVNGGEALVTAFIVLMCCVFAYIIGNINVRERGNLSKVSRINEAIVLAAGGYYIANLNAPFKIELIFAYAAIVLFVYALAFIRVNRDISADTHPLLQIYSGIKLTALTLCTARGFTSWLDYGYVVSIIVMVTALICVLAGFKFRAKALRVYGLVMTMICVSKLVIIDVWGASTPMRVIAMISGGLICFAVNAAYSYAVKHLDRDAELDAPQSGEARE